MQIIKYIAVLSAAALIGQWFLAELKKSRRLNRPWYTPYLSPPGLLILGALLLPVVIRLMK